jgi:deazaflavin-dependent oxidoreductase (nitroreductase family)
MSVDRQSEEIVDNPDGWVANHIREYVATDGREGHRLSGWKASTLLLVTRGRRSGRLRRTAVAYGEHDGRYVIIASNGGATRHPDWCLNLVADLAVQVQVRNDKFVARARDATPEEKPSPWNLMTSLGGALDDFQRSSGREIPVVVLERM